MQTPKNEIKPLELIEIGYRRRWVIILPLFISVAVGLYLAFVLPKVYRASATILVQPQQVPKEYIRSAVPEEDSKFQEKYRLSMIAQQIFTTQVLERVISDYDLYSDPDKSNIPMKSKIDRLRNSVMIELMEEGLYSNAYIVSFSGEDPQTARDVTNSLVNYLIDTDKFERESSATGTSKFLDEELETTRERLGEMEGTVKNYRERFMGELPEQLDSNLKTLERLQNQLDVKEGALRSIRLELSSIDKQIEENRYSQVLDGLARNQDILEMETTDIGLLREQLANLLTRYTEEHPDVKRLKSKIAQLEAEIETQKGRSGLAGSSAFSSKGRYLTQIELRREALQNEKSAVENNIADLKREMADYQKRVENIPKREQEYIILNRDYNNLNQLYQSLLNRKLEAEMTVNMERKQKGGQYQLIDSARLPRKPAEPNLKLMIILSIALGLGLGCGLALLQENMRVNYSEPEEIETELKLPVIAAIPRVLTKRDVLLKRTELALCSLFLAMTVTGICVFAFVTILGTDQAIENVRQYIPNYMIH